MTTNAQVVQLFTDVLARWNEREAEFRNWQAGTPEGGPNADGLYPLTNGSGETFLVACPAKLASTVSGPAVLSQAAKVAAEAAQAASETASTSSINAKDLAENHKVAAQAAKDLAKTYRDQCAAAQAAVSSFQAIVLAKHEVVVAKAGEVEVYHGEVIAAKDDTLIARSEAAQARDQAAAYAASINPELLATKVELDSELAALVGSSPETLNTLNEFAAALGNDPNFATSVSNSIASKAPLFHGHELWDVAGLETALAGKQQVGSYVLNANFNWSSLAGKPSQFMPTIHSHPVWDVDGLETALAGKQPVGSYVLNANFNWSSLAGKPSQFMPTIHSHPVWDVDGLQSALDNRLVRQGGNFVLNVSNYGLDGATVDGSGASIGGWARYFAIKGGTTDSSGAFFSAYGGNSAAYSVRIGVGDPAVGHDQANALEITATGMSWAGVPVSLSNHTHAYLPLSGGTIYGRLIYKNYVLEQWGSGSASALNCIHSFRDGTGAERGWVGFDRGTTTMGIYNTIGTILINDVDVLASLGTKMDLTSTQFPTGRKLFVSDGQPQSSSDPTLQAVSVDANGAFMSFHRLLSYAINVGLDSNNIFRIGGWSAPANLFKLLMNGDMLINDLGVPKWTTAGQTSGNMTVSTAGPSGGADGDIWYKVVS